MYCTLFRDTLQAWFAPRFDAPIEDASLSAYALYYASLGWHVFPLCTPGLDGRCTFHRRRCYPGKEPRIRGWPRKATTDVDTIKGWWHTWPGANIGLVTGRASGTFAVDIDPRRGGHYTLADLEAAHGRLPETVLALSGGGGQHYYLKTPVCKLTGGNDALGPGIDVKADGGFIVAPPSRHVSGMRYEWEVSSRPGEVAVADPPGWLFAMLTEKGAPSSARARNKGVMDPSRLSAQRNPNGSPNKRSNTWDIGDGSSEEINDLSAQMPPLNMDDFSALKHDPLEQFYCAHRSLKLAIAKVLRPGEGTSNFRCPFCRDRKPSASLYCADNGAYVLREWHGSEAEAETRGRYYTLPEVLASQAYGTRMRLTTNPEALVWWLKLKYMAGLLEPVEVPHADLPETVMPFIHQVYDGFRLLLGLKWTHAAGEPTAFSRRFAAAWCGVTERQMTMSMQYLLGRRYLVKAPRFAGKGRTYATFAVGEGPNPGA